MKENLNVFVGGAWPYANNSMHVGHLAALLPADIIARYYRDNGSNVIYVSGTDSHGTPITVRAKSEKVSPQSIAERYHKEFKETFDLLKFTFDAYNATYEDVHKQRAGELIEKIYENGYLYKKTEEQDFCEKCDTFLTDRNIVGTCPVCGGVSRGDQCDHCLTSLEASQLTDKKCKDCGTDTVLRETDHLMFKLSEFDEFLAKYQQENKKYWRTNAINETEKYLKMGLRDRAATRNIPWGLDVPIPGFEDKKIYVWFEAVLGYLTLGEKVAKERGISFADFMKNSDSLETYYVHGKDNIPFHTVIYPALLGALNEDIQLPKRIISSEYITANNQKMSKSLGNLVSAYDLAKKYPADTVRFYISTISPEKRDTNFSVQDMVQTHNTFLVGGLGNFVNRAVSFIGKTFDGKIPDGKIDDKIISETEKAYTEIGTAIENGEIKSATDKVKAYIQSANKYFAESAPWKISKDDLQSLKNVLATSVFMARNMANLFEPFLPEATAKLKTMFAASELKWQVSYPEPGLKLSNENGLLYSKLELTEEAQKIQQGSVKIKNQAVKENRKQQRQKHKEAREQEKAANCQQREAMSFNSFNRQTHSANITPVANNRHIPNNSPSII